MNYKTALIIIVQLCFFTSINAQENFKLAGFGSVFYPQAEIKDNAQNSSIAIIEHAAFINIPFVLKNKKTIIINGLGYSWLEINGENTPTIIDQGKQLHAIYYQMIIAHKINEKWSLIANLKPTLATDFEEKLSFDDFVLQGGILTTRRINKEFKLVLTKKAGTFAKY